MYALLALVVRPVNQKELNSNLEAQKSLDAEWEKLVKKSAWIIESVQEWDDVSAESKRKGKKVYAGKVFEICVEKGSEFPRPTPCVSLQVGPCFKVTMYRTKTPVQRCFQN